MAIQDIIHDTLIVNYSGAYNDLIMQFFNDNAASTVGLAFYDAKAAWLAENKGYSTGSVFDRDIAYLKGLGYTGSYQDMLGKAISDHNYFTL